MAGKNLSIQAGQEKFIDKRKKKKGERAMKDLKDKKFGFLGWGDRKSVV